MTPRDSVTRKVLGAPNHKTIINLVNWNIRLHNQLWSYLYIDILQKHKVTSISKFSHFPTQSQCNTPHPSSRAIYHVLNYMILTDTAFASFDVLTQSTENRVFNVAAFHRAMIDMGKMTRTLEVCI